MFDSQLSVLFPSIVPRISNFSTNVTTLKIMCSVFSDSNYIPFSSTECLVIYSSDYQAPHTILSLHIFKSVCHIPLAWALSRNAPPLLRFVKPVKQAILPKKQSRHPHVWPLQLFHDLPARRFFNVMAILGVVHGARRKA